MDITEQLEKGLANITAQLDTFQAKQEEEIKTLGTSHDETISTIKALTERADQLKDRLDTVEKNTNRIPAEKKTFASSLAKQIEENKDQIERLAKNGTRFNMEIKTPMTTGANYTGEVIESDRLAGVYFDPDRPTHVRQFIPQASTDSNNVRYVVEESYTDGTAMQEEGYEKGQSSFKLKSVDAPVETIASYIRLSRQMLDDTAFLTSYINQRLPKKLFLEEDAQVLYGDGASPNLEGITEVAQAFNKGSFSIGNKFDTLIAAISQARTVSGEYMANGILVNPSNWYEMLLEKDQEGRYLFPDAVRFGGQPPRVGGVPIFQSTAVTADDFIVGDWAMGATMAVRQGVSLTFHEEDQDNVIKNLITVRIEERLALPIHNPNAFVYGTFTY